jgi:flagellar protein FlbD
MNIFVRGVTTGAPLIFFHTEVLWASPFNITIRGGAMIRVTRINNKELVVNAELIEFIEQTPDSIISLTTGKKFAVVDTIEEIIRKVIEYRIKIQPLRSSVERPDEKME